VPIGGAGTELVPLEEPPEELPDEPPELPPELPLLDAMTDPELPEDPVELPPLEERIVTVPLEEPTAPLLLEETTDAVTLDGVAVLVGDDWEPEQAPSATANKHPPYCPTRAAIVDI